MVDQGDAARIDDDDVGASLAGPNDFIADDRVGFGRI